MQKIKNKDKVTYKVIIALCRHTPSKSGCLREKGMMGLIKQMAWNTFKNTGDINTFLELVEVENIEKNMIEAEKQNGNIKIKGYSNFGKQFK